MTIVRLILAILLPFVVFFNIKRPIQGFFCFFLQLSLIGWIPAAIWALYSLGQYKTDKKIEASSQSPN
ncbi:YqaE/Pmp3 family membrane protein [uncultured Ruegeria sp.]|uniref:YqaE/Pmp3 family membrane protein n=1 Tax=uncultured Ruegeria sp. TaxID=259304 RepID=UPI002605DD57|nr:YqaE/Pmp3 family membrane protein [uncultured Ruegeria sp.]